MLVSYSNTVTPIRFREAANKYKNEIGLKVYIAYKIDVTLFSYSTFALTLNRKERNKLRLSCAKLSSSWS